MPWVWILAALFAGAAMGMLAVCLVRSGRSETEGGKDRMVNKGDRVKDKITGLTGIVWAITDYLHGCRRIHVQPEQLTPDGKVQETFVFDEPQLEVIEASAYEIEVPKKPKKQEPGGPHHLKADKPQLGGK